MLKELNLNEHIHVYLDENGKRILREYYNIEDISFHFESKELPGHYVFSIWEFADIFGGTGAGNSAPYSCVAFIRG